MKKISWIVVVCFLISACKKERIEPEQYPFVFIKSGFGTRICHDCMLNSKGSSSTQMYYYIEIDKNYYFYIKNQSNVVVYKGKIKKLKLTEASEQFQYISEYDAILPDEYKIKYLNYKFEVDINNTLVLGGNYGAMMRNLNEIIVKIGTYRKTKLVNNQVVTYYEKYSIIIGFTTNYSWEADRVVKTKNTYSYSFKKEI